MFLVVPQIICNAHKQNLQKMLKSACSHVYILNILASEKKKKEEEEHNNK